MISISGLAKSFGDHTLFEGVTLQLNAGERYGVVGANASGKSTLLKILSGEETASSGSVSIAKKLRVATLSQDHFQYEQERIVDVVMMGDAPLWEAMAEKERLLANAESHFDGDRYSELEDLIVQRDGYALESRAAEILEGLGIPTESHPQPLSTLSGGFKLRVLLAQVLASAPDVMLLDEPTNHLDIVSIRWLEKFLESFRGCVAVVSHDHRFLDNVATVIVDVDYQAVKAYRGNYQRFMVAKREERERREREISKREDEIAHHKAFVERFRAKATKARQAQSRVKAIAKIEIEELPQTSRRYPRFKFRQRRPSGRQVLEMEAISKRYGDNVVLDDVSLTIARGERVAILGPNGIGKSTLLMIAMGEVEADAGRSEWGYEAAPGYFAQDHRETLGSARQTVEGALAEVCPGESIGFVRGHLGAVLFSGDEVEKKVQALSGGEAARLVFARLAVKQSNVMVLDEPTNHLDLEAIEALVEALEAYDGTLIFVSHDRWFVGELATRIIEITSAGINDFPGTYAEYLERCGDDHLDAEVVLRKVRAARRKDRGASKGARSQGGRPSGPRPGGARERRELLQRLEEVTAAIQQAEERVAKLDEQFCDPNFFQRTPGEQVQALELERRNLSAKIAEWLEEWEQVEARLEEIPPG